ncbi:uncharacterized protein [Solanum lycopersicum]|uniref:uncharacterized protein n=1 Tax=Solanum lycopersicum TaxID=4081 RepID=UPI00374A7C0D
MAKKIDHDHPLFLGSSDVPGAVQIGIQFTGMENYTLWSRAMQLNLLTKNELGFIDGSIQRDGFTTEIEKKQWDRCNAMVLSWIMSNVSKDLVSGILFRSNAAQVWLDLQERFDKVNMSRIFHLHKAIVTHTQGISPVSVYYSKLKDLWDEFYSIVPPPSCKCDKSKDYSDSMDRQKLLQFLMGLNESYAQARSQILMLNPPPSVNQCYAMIVQDKSQRELSGEYSGGGITDPTALLTNKSGSYQFGGSGSRGKGGRSYGSSRQQRGGGSYCDHYEMRGHTREDCNKLKHCTHCNIQGHTKDICFQLIGYPSDWKGKKRVNIVQASPAEGIPQMQGQQRSEVESQFGPSTSGGVGPVPYFTLNQYNQILHILKKHNMNEVNEHMAGTFAGTSFCNVAANCSSEWIVDSG